MAPDLTPYLQARVPHLRRFSVELSREICSRDEFGLLCDWRALWRAVELGTDRGAFAKAFLDRWHGHTLWCIDSYASYAEMPWDRMPDMLFAANLLAGYIDRVRLVGTTGQQFLQSVEGERVKNVDPTIDKFEVEFVYIDGAHRYEAVKADLEMWWEVLSWRGILAGHDYHPALPGVIRAVNEFAELHDLSVYLTSDDQFPSWYVYKTEPDADWTRIPR